MSKGYVYVMLYIFNKIKTYLEIYIGRLNKTDFRKLNNFEKFEGIAQNFIHYTAKNIVISPNFLCGNFVERHIFRIVSGDSPETMRELCLSTKFPHQEIRCNYGIFCSAISCKMNSYFMKHL